MQLEQAVLQLPFESFHLRDESFLFFTSNPFNAAVPTVRCPACIQLGQAHGVRYQRSQITGEQGGHRWIVCTAHDANEALPTRRFSLQSLPGRMLLILS